MSDLDCIIVGQGLAGSTLALRLWSEGWKVLVVDREDPVTSSKIAAGLITPITGKNLTRSWRLEEALEAAASFYQTAEGLLGGQFWYPKPILRVFRDVAEVSDWQAKKTDPGYTPFLSRPEVSPERIGAWLNAGHGGFEMQGGGYVDVRVFIKSAQRFLKSNGLFQAGEVSCQDVKAATGGVLWNGVPAKYLIYCQGFQGAQNRFFDWVAFRSAKGEVLDIEMVGFSAKRIINSGGWVLPVGGNRFRTGSTYSWDPLDCKPTKGGRRRVEKNLRRLLSADYTVLDHQAAVRPIINASKALVGLHPKHDRVGFFNGLGSKGALYAPYFSAQLTAHLVEGAPLEEGLDIRKNF